MDLSELPPLLLEGFEERLIVLCAELVEEFEEDPVQVAREDPLVGCLLVLSGEVLEKSADLSFLVEIDDIVRKECEDDAVRGEFDGAVVLEFLNVDVLFPEGGLVPLVHEILSIFVNSLGEIYEIFVSGVALELLEALPEPLDLLRPGEASHVKLEHGIIEEVETHEFVELVLATPEEGKIGNPAPVFLQKEGRLVDVIVDAAEIELGRGGEAQVEDAGLRDSVGEEDLPEVELNLQLIAVVELGDDLESVGSRIAAGVEVEVHGSEGGGTQLFLEVDPE